MATIARRIIRNAPTTTRAGGSFIRALASTSRRTDSARVQVTGAGTGGIQQITVPDTPFRVTADTYKQFGGTESSPSPLHFNLASLASCTQITGVIAAKDAGISLGQWQVAVDGDWDPAVLVTGVDGNANWQTITVKVEVATNADDARFKKWTEDVERRCPVSQLFKRSGVNYKSMWNNKELS